MSASLYEQVFNQALTKIRQICSPRSPRIEDNDLNINTIQQLDCLDFGEKDSNIRKTVIDEVKQISVSCLQFIFSKLFEEYGYSAQIIQNYDDTLNIPTIGKSQLNYPLFSFYETKTNSVLFFKEVEQDLVWIKKNYEPEYVKPIIEKTNASSFKYVYFMWNFAYLQIRGYNDDANDPGRGYNWYALKWFFETYFNMKELLLFHEAFSRFKEIANDFIGFISIKTLSYYSLAYFKIIVEGQLMTFDYYRLQNKKEKSGYLLPDDWAKINNQYINQRFFLLLRGSGSFAESFITAEWLYNSMKKAKVIDLTTIGTGYFKCIEQLLFELICLRANQKLYFSSKNGNKKELTNDIILNDKFDFTIGTMAHICEDNLNELIREDLGKYGKESIKKRIFQYGKLRNGYFHKDNIHDWNKIDEIRNYTFDMLFLLIGGFKLSKSDLSKLGYPNIEKFTDYHFLCEYINYHAGDLFYIQLPNGDEHLVIAKSDYRYNIDDEDIIHYSGIYFKKFLDNNPIYFQEGQSDFPQRITHAKAIFPRGEEIHTQLAIKRNPLYENGKFLGPRISEEIKEY